MSDAKYPKSWAAIDLSSYLLAPDDYQRLAKLRDEIAWCIRHMDHEALLALRLTIAEAEDAMTEIFGSPRDLEAVLRASREGTPS